MGVASINDFTEHICQVGELKHEEGVKDAITEVELLMRGHHIGSNSPDGLKMPGSMDDRIAETLIYGKGRKSEADLKIGEIKKALIDPAKQSVNKNWKAKQ